MRIASLLLIPSFALIVLATIAGAQDADSDGVPDATDNCIDVFNPSQHNSNADAFGNVCDADYDNDGLVGMRDFLVHRKSEQNTVPPADPDADHSEPPDNFVGHLELGFFGASWGSPPGP